MVFMAIGAQDEAGCTDLRIPLACIKGDGAGIAGVDRQPQRRTRSFAGRGLCGLKERLSNATTDGMRLDIQLLQFDAGIGPSRTQRTEPDDGHADEQRAAFGDENDGGRIAQGGDHPLDGKFGQHMLCDVVRDALGRIDKKFNLAFNYKMLI